jgi:Sec-independent protein secretion pathway component TatC
MSYKYKNICTVQLKFSHKTTKENKVVTLEATEKYTHTHYRLNLGLQDVLIPCVIQLLFIPLTFLFLIGKLASKIFRKKKKKKS